MTSQQQHHSDWLGELHAVLVSLLGGARYGAKIRFPHALVMTFLFRIDLTFRHKLKSIVFLVTEHATNLASFAALYKLILVALKYTSRRQWLQSGLHHRHRSSRNEISVAPSHRKEEGMFRLAGRYILSMLGT
jgi:hypothetical protein